MNDSDNWFLAQRNLKASDKLFLTDGISRVTLVVESGSADRHYNIGGARRDQPGHAGRRPRDCQSLGLSNRIRDLSILHRGKNSYSGPYLVPHSDPSGRLLLAIDNIS
jgi:hypothetical protein